MKLLDSYIARTVAGHIGTVMLVLLAIYFFSTFVSEMGDVGKGDYTVLDALLFTLMQVPLYTYQLFPLVALVGTMLGLGSLANTSELTVMRAAGVSIRRIMVAVMKVGLMMVVAVTVVGELIAPRLEVQAQMQRAEALGKDISLNTKDGLWARDGRSFINIERLLVDGRASNVRIYRFDDNHSLRETIFAPRGIYQDDAWQLEQVVRTRVTPEGVDSRQLGELRWESSLEPGVIDVVAIKPENLSARDLWEYLRYMRENGLEDRRYDLAFWVRIMIPFATAGMVLLAVPFVFGSMRTVSIGQRVMLGALLGIGFYLFNAIFNRVGVVYDIPPFLAASLPTFVVYILWGVMMRRIR
ncbi:LPS export ABC transporter permease LptG [Thiohalomonas denitrificans]|uniref:Lipopolysaccharide export system permease protein n=1 Tax=Thiohalomonas denitrificans TaxID=415747 RepID=A0A1G5PY77_9GAMM|nr:LPS export ABC transporter permease LptG [Thiohalomonas denitrificans]SCZ54463.1 lipopolysaccharide export system permease protein [Thiohalomonas denitrificans]